MYSYRPTHLRTLHLRVKDKHAAYGAVFVGNVNASALAKTRQAKSVLDAG
jgi:hypothetical protein